MTTVDYFALETYMAEMGRLGRNLVCGDPIPSILGIRVSRGRDWGAHYHIRLAVCRE